MAVTIVQYRTRPERADENQQLVEAVFRELRATAPRGLRYASYRLDEHWTFVARYRYEHYTQKDWQFDGLGVTTLTSTVEGQPLLGTNSDVFLRNGLPRYDVSFFSVSAVLSF